jgi:hypothetical protein
MSHRKLNDLCTTFTELAIKTWLDIRDAYRLRAPIGEESITDYLLLELKRRHNSEIKIVKFTRWMEGKRTGADWEWWLGGQGAWYGMRVQAKKLDSQTSRYTALHHKTPRASVMQVTRLIKDAKKHNLYPMYCFYNFCEPPRQPQWWYRWPTPEAWGCTIADAQRIRSAIKKGHDSWDEISDISLPWTSLICHGRASSSGGRALANNAYRIGAALRHEIGQRSDADRNTRQEVPEPVAQLPAEVRQLLELQQPAEQEEPPARFAGLKALVVFDFGEGSITTQS